ncbi:MAG: CBS domain-containing protein [Treponema sp.]|jgi:tRNA nucleotidyltransferase (CCA-adding enzyme)|nr:CBS domain-containing protein [Treponema sp.]
MNIAFGHTNMDMDCLGALILVKKLFPDYRLVRSRIVDPAAQNLYNLYEGYFDFLNPKDLETEDIEQIIIVDTCRAARVEEYFSRIRGRSPPRVSIFDHHQTALCDIPCEAIEDGKTGALTSYLAKKAMKRRVSLLPQEATIALAGIYSDTGRLLYENTRPADFEAAAWLLGQGASLRLVKSFLETIKDDKQIEVLHSLFPRIERRKIQGHDLLFSTLELDAQVKGLAAVVERVMEMQNPDAYFAVFVIPKNETMLLIARSQKPAIDLHELLSAYGGGGHQAAASAKFRGTDAAAFIEELCSRLETSLKPALRAADIMTPNVCSIYETSTLREASLFLERVNLTGVPVVNVDGLVTGFLSLRDIMKGRKARAMKAPVSAYMSRPPLSAGPAVTLRDIEKIFYEHHIGHLPIVENGKLIGIVTRWDYLAHKGRIGS